MPEAPPQPTSQKTPAMMWWGLLVVFAIFAPALANDYAVDAKVLANPFGEHGDPKPFMQQLHRPWFYFTQNYWAVAEVYDGLYRPVPIFSFALTNHFLGTVAGCHRIFDILLHLLAIWLLFRVLLDLRVDRQAATWTALLFGFLAIHHEAVVSIVGRAESLSLVAGLGTLLLYARPGVKPKIGAAALLLLAFGSKESSLAWIAFLPCYELARRWLVGPRAFMRSYLLVVVPPLLLWFVLRELALADMAHMPRQIANLKNPLAHVDATTRILTAIKIWGYGLYKCIFAWPLSHIYGMGVFTNVTSVANAGFLGSAAGLGSFLLCGLMFAKRCPLLFLATATFFGFSFVSSNVLFPAGTNFGERLFYIPSLGVCLLATVLLQRLEPHRKPILIGLAAFALANAAVILLRNPDWDSDPVILQADVHARPDSAQIRDHLAAFQYGKGPEHREAALEHVRRAVAIYPEYPRALYKLGSHHQDRGETREALAFYARASHSPDVLIVTRIQIQQDIESILYPQGTARLSLEQLQGVLNQNPDLAAAWVGLLEGALRQGALPTPEAREAMRGAFDQARQRFQTDDLIGILRGVFYARDGVQDAAEARMILADFRDGLWRLPYEATQAYYIEANVFAAQAFAVLGEHATANHVLDRLLACPDLPAGYEQAIEKERAGLRRR